MTVEQQQVLETSRGSDVDEKWFKRLASSVRCLHMLLVKKKLIAKYRSVMISGLSEDHIPSREDGIQREGNTSERRGRCGVDGAVCTEEKDRHVKVTSRTEVR